MNEYKEKLIALLEGLECREIDDLIEKPPEYIKEFGFSMKFLIKMLIKRAMNDEN